MGARLSMHGLVTAACMLSCMLSTLHGSHREVLLPALHQLVQASCAKQVHDLPLLMRPHAREDHHIAHHRLQQGQVSQMQHVLKGEPCHATLCLALRQKLSSSRTSVARGNL